MTTMTLADLADRRVTLDEQIERLQQEKALVNAEILKMTQEQPGNYAAGEFTLQIKAGAKRLDSEMFAQRFPVAQYPHLYEPKPSTAAIKENFSPIELEKFQKRGAASVAVK